MTLYLLGTGAAVSDAHRTTTMLAVEEAGSLLLIDCGGDAVQRMMAAGLDPLRIKAVFLTHEHPDHIGGFPLLMEKLWLLGRRDPLPIYGPAAALAVTRAVFDTFNTKGWEGLPEREWHDVALEAGAPVFESDAFRVTATPVIHPVPTLGVRIEGASGAVLAYSCDTAKSDNVVRLAREADLLVHEATGSQPGVHSSPEEAADVAAQAGAYRLVLVHLPPGLTDDDLAAARHRFTMTELGEEGGVYALSASSEVPPPSGP